MAYLGSLQLLPIYPPYSFPSESKVCRLRTCTGVPAAATLAGRADDFVPMSCRLKLSPCSRLLAEAAPYKGKNKEQRNQVWRIKHHEIPGLPDSKLFFKEEGPKQSASRLVGIILATLQHAAQPCWELNRLSVKHGRQDTAPA